MTKSLGQCFLFKETMDFMIKEMRDQTKVICGSGDNCRLADTLECLKQLPMTNIAMSGSSDISNLLNYNKICE